MEQIAGLAYAGHNLATSIRDTDEMRALARSKNLYEGSDAWVMAETDRGREDAFEELDRRTRP